MPQRRALCSCFREIQVENKKEPLALAKAWEGLSAWYRTEVKGRIDAECTVNPHWKVGFLLGQVPVVKEQLAGRAVDC